MSGLYEEIDLDLSKKSGFHGKSKEASTTECRSCHTDHIGRSAEITGLNRHSFNHNTTDFKLDGHHKNVDCDACHTTKKKFREAPGLCNDCHENDDIHRNKLGEQCDNCHTTDQWKESSFDHEKTEFPLEGAHADAACNSCHLADRYKNIPTECNDCHQVDDIHNQSYGTSCADCHTPEKWTSLDFNHDQETDFPLKEAHKTAECSSCHKGGIKADELKTTCNACHAENDIHRKRFGQKCENCHSEKSWDTTKFKHDVDTDYTLKGNHKNLSCESCHQSATNNETDITRTCIDCHRADDIHKGGEGETCSNCHNEQKWSSKIRFDHDLTNFPLIGLHALPPCEACHINGEFQDTPKTCLGCHEADDVHSKNLGTDCQTCHTPNDWKLWNFDHTTQTDFSLDGKHQNLDCLACHLAPLENNRSLPKHCAGCHREDDIHDGDFGGQCDRCHSTKDFITPDIQN